MCDTELAQLLYHFLREVHERPYNVDVEQVEWTVPHRVYLEGPGARVKYLLDDLDISLV